MINWEGIYEALNPTLVCRRYAVEVYWFGHGKIEHYWRLKSAKAAYRRWFLKRKAEHLLTITLRDHWIADEHEPTWIDDERSKLELQEYRYFLESRVIWTSGQLLSPEELGKYYQDVGI